MTSTTTKGAPATKAPASLPVRIAVAWTIVGVPLAYGVYETVKKASALFG